MDASNWSALGSVGAAVFAAASAFLSYRAATADAKSADFDNCLEIVAKLAEHERLVRDATSDDLKLSEIRALINFMEALAHLYNANKITPSTREFVKHYLIEAWAFLRCEQMPGSALLDSLTSPTTYAELGKFAEKHKKEIEEQTAIYLAQKDS